MFERERANESLFSLQTYIVKIEQILIVNILVKVDNYRLGDGLSVIQAVSFTAEIFCGFGGRVFGNLIFVFFPRQMPLYLGSKVIIDSRMMIMQHY